MLEWRKHPILKPPTDEEIAVMEPSDLVNLHYIYHEAIKNSEEDPYNYAFRLPHWELAEKELGNHNEILVSGGNRSGKSWSSGQC